MSTTSRLLTASSDRLVSLAEKGISINPVNELENLSRADARAAGQLVEENEGPGVGRRLDRINGSATDDPTYAGSIQLGCARLAAGCAAPNVCG